MTDDETIENNLSEHKLVKDVLSMDIDQFDRYKKGVMKGLIRFGSSFDYHLGLLLQHADHANTVRILSVWQKECMKCEMLYRIYKAKLDSGAIAD